MNVLTTVPVLHTQQPVLISHSPILQSLIHRAPTQTTDHTGLLLGSYSETECPLRVNYSFINEISNIMTWNFGTRSS